jgi:hypothetical protein
MLALAAVSGVAQGISRVEVANWLAGEGLWSYLSPACAFIAKVTSIDTEA